MALPHRCSYIDNGSDCQLSPSYIVSVETDNGEYMIAVVCQDHRDEMSIRLKALQHKNTIPKGKTRFQEMTMIGTDCVRGPDDENTTFPF
jgi:hypothetical protein